MQSSITVDDTSTLTQGENVKIENSVVVARNHATIFLEDNVVLDGYQIHVQNGFLRIGNSSIFRRAEHYKPVIAIDGGTAEFLDHNIFNASLYVKWNGFASIGQYTAIKQGTEIRCEDRVEIGDFCMISYECLIFDTNTHEILPAEERRSRTIKDFPSIGAEYRKPETLTICIGNDVWVGQRACILKGAWIENEAIVGLGAVVTGTVPERCVAVGNPARIVER